MQLFKIFSKKTSKRYYYPLLSLLLACILIFTSVSFSQAQEDSSTSQPPNTNSTQIENTNTPQQPSNELWNAPRVTTIRSVSPKELYISIPQSLVPENINNYKQERLNLVITGDNFPKIDNSANKKIAVKIGNPPDIATTNNIRVADDRRAIYATFNGDQLKKLSRGLRPVIVEVEGNATNIDPSLGAEQLQVTVKRPVSELTTFIVFAIAALFTFLIIAIIYVLATESKKTDLPQPVKESNTRKFNSLEWLILDRQTNTFSLARAQFVWWLTIIVFGYLFLFIGRGLIQDIWEFIPLSGFAYTFLISLVTLVTAQATSAVRGSKGSGQVNPAWSDLVVHGGVVALERVQQVVWNLIIGVAFIVILLVTYTTASSLPTIPSEILVLMGISAGGYIGGKAVRKPGPNISQVVLWGEPIDWNTNPQLTIAGEHFSQADGVIVQMVYLDESLNEKPDTRIEIKQDNVSTLEPDPTNPGEFCKKLQINFNGLNALPDSEWSAWLQEFASNFTDKKVKITLINADGQRAVWDGSNPVPERRNAPALQAP
ncbi:hypothetical protein HCG51_17845 [Tolypothrix sp. PCC 7910]|uniref:hypothetical protein n=1 Tax=Tolypothrix sp. PCC 7910 TaxID=2099387 RepID=UPI0014279F0A|nr:hypothetical protein [Tolypothrix sp. PCC 7910]QIR38385.1 hypothetical protein HCG51_17845 [Tolypothrix sp. PCC 7910]